MEFLDIVKMESMTHSAGSSNFLTHVARNVDILLAQ